MDAQQIRRLKPKLVRYLRTFDNCFGRSDTRAHLPVYVRGQLSNLPRKSVEPIALAAHVPPRTLQQFLGTLAWDHEQMRDRLQQLVAREHADPGAIGLIDETSCPKKGTKTPGVQRQWCGAKGKTDNCIVTVHLGYSTGDFHCLLDGELFLPKSWSEDRPRCRDADIPDEVVYRPKWRIALELYDRARANGVQFAWLTFDEGYGGKPEFLRELTRRGQLFVAEVPKTFTGRLKAPQVAQRPYRRRRTPRLARGSRPLRSVERHYYWAEPLKSQRWRTWRVRDGVQGPMVWETKHVRLTPPNEHGLPDQPLHLIVARNVHDRLTRKYFVSNAPAGTPVGSLLRVGLSRWPVERCFEDEKGELGLAHFEGRSYVGLKRHLILTAVSHLFLARMQQALAGEKTGIDGLPGASGSGHPGRLLGSDRTPVGSGHRTDGVHTGVHAATQCPGAEEPCQTHPPETAGVRHHTGHAGTVFVQQ